ncbi:hypothetical protein [Halovivax limisalsi]|uniref:hypothetical protein n=1 Tax=Halovivax limisalsi TaxID=1453760 RepID=UPI001FFC6DFD|nr:hypothetical protein [Halovivax limisalsi]
MESQAEPETAGTETDADDERPLITAHELTDRYVFTETENTDGWIASTLTIDVIR